MPSLRHQRVRELLKRAIGEVVRREFSLEDVGLVSVNDVECAGDLKSAVVYLSVLGTAEQQQRGLLRLEERRARIQELLGAAVVLKYTPKLKFVMDDTIARGDRVMQILNELEPHAASGGPLPENQPSDR
ncbi:MAG TPA: 30S ribosome-binding factor RbfA [Verrucomicrobiota bacterium]|nr:30S ribosome-binding factor RbfA [Verrucomicrobiota bacterium]HNT14616.1 30S ribosome-binding factor RbfA [Verrucomicrobiota bacterium]